MSSQGRFADEPLANALGRATDAAMMRSHRARADASLTAPRRFPAVSA